MHRPEEVQITCRSAATVLKVGEEEPGGVTKTTHGCGDPCRGRQRMEAWDVGAQGQGR
jgi:hypothetical protein